jgi:hypothetical protein
MITKWKIAYKRTGTFPFDLSGLRVWETPVTQYEADPFLVEHKGENFLFYELFDHKKGVIAYSRMSTLTTAAPSVCLEEPFHLSYPSIFKDGGEIYMTPECGASGEVRLYKATHFPDKWEAVSVIRKGVADDNDVIRYGGKWYLFTTTGTMNIHIWKADTLGGKWEHHFGTDIKDSRGAGRPFEYNGKLIRPCQDSDDIYGKGVILKSINLPLYEEEEFKRLEIPLSGAVGIHTFNFNKTWTVVDLKYRYETDSN